MLKLIRKLFKENRILTKMLGKKCRNCGERIRDNNRFCPNCGIPLKKNNPEEWGMLGREDLEEEDFFSDSFFRGFGGNMFNKMLGSAMKMLENEMKKEMERSSPQPRTNIRLMINGKEIDLNQAKKHAEAKKTKKSNAENFSKENLKKFSELPRKEPKTNIRRLSDRVIYEIEMPGVKSIKDVSVNQLENSIEIKAVAKDNSYFKLIPINLPVLDYELSEEKLVLELEAKN